MRLRRALGPALGELFSALLLTLLVVSVVFLALRALPFDVSDLLLDEQASLDERSRLRASLGLDKPLFSQLLDYLAGLVRGRAGASYRHPDSDALGVVWDALPNTAALAALSVTLGALWGIGCALLAVARRDFVGAGASLLLDTTATIPLLALAPIATWLFALRLRLVPLPADPDAGFRGLLFASLLLSLPLGATVGRLARASLRSLTDAPFLRVARAKGRSVAACWLVHGVPPIAGVLLTALSAQLGALLGGAIILEKVLERRGLGTLLAEAIASRDLPVLQATVAVSTLAFVVIQALGRLLHRVVDPRVS